MADVNVLKDERVECYSILLNLTVEEFLALVDDVYKDRGGIEGQRSPLRTKTAKSIRRRMVDDLSKGAIIPPIVVGVHTSADRVAELANMDESSIIYKNITFIDHDAISIIDGMQRTTALKEAIKENERVSSDFIRVEFWLADNLNALIYRMLVLNTGQVPWEVARQLETVYSQLLKIMRDELGNEAEFFVRNEERRRSEPGQYQASTVVRLFLAFSMRRAEFDIRDRVAEDFARMDAIETSSHAEFIDIFVRTMRLAVSIDHAFSAGVDRPSSRDERFSDGRELFQAYPPLVGFFVAVAIRVLDQPGFKIEWNEVEQRISAVEKSVRSLVERLEKMDADQIDDFLELPLLNERLAQRSGQVGRFERDLFIRAFTAMIDNAERLDDMGPCWKS